MAEPTDQEIADELRAVCETYGLPPSARVLEQHLVAEAAERVRSMGALLEAMREDNEALRGARPRRDPRRAMTDREEQNLHETARFLQQEGFSAPLIDEWAERYEREQQVRAEMDLAETDGEFVVLLGQSKAGGFVRAIGPITGRISAEGLAEKVRAPLQEEWVGLIEWFTAVLPLAQPEGYDEDLRANRDDDGGPETGAE